MADPRQRLALKNLQHTLCCRNVESDFESTPEGLKLVGYGWTAECTPYLSIMVKGATFCDQGEATGTLRDGIDLLIQDKTSPSMAESIVRGLIEGTEPASAVFDAEKMRKLASSDPFLTNSLSTLTHEGSSEETALEVLFNSYVMDDPDMIHAYEN